MNKVAISSTVVAGAAALMMLTGTSALAQMQMFPPGTDCSRLPDPQQTDCRVQGQNSAAGPSITDPGFPAGNGMRTNQNSTLNPSGSAGQTNGSGSGTSGGNGGANQSGQSGN